ncbi:MAG TPA: c-type cytochrome domain-containing protein, partial [Planctomycetaceae bacterium]|nr:c-type cytochrome domain-containing protein [Planctomycetaceae bacterium]
MARRTGFRVRRTAASLALIGCLLAPVTATSAGANADTHPGPTFERDVLPIFKAYCWHCHGGEACVAGLDLRTFPLLLRGGKIGPAIVRGSAKESLIFKKFGGDLAQHPPEHSRPTEAHMATLRAWIDAGAPADDEGR